MSQDRILGSSCLVEIYDSSGNPVPFGEIDSFTSEPQHEMKTFHPLGQVQQHGQIIYKGYKLSFKGAKINGDLEQIQYILDQALLNGQAAPRYRITELTTLYSGTVEKWVYDGALIYNVKVDKSNAEDEIKQDLEGWAPTKMPG
jgi:hypothetical protein